MNKKNPKSHDTCSNELEKNIFQSSHYKTLFFFLFLEVETSSVKNAFLIGEINFKKKFNTFENDTHEREREAIRAKNKQNDIQLKTEEVVAKLEQLFEDWKFFVDN